VESSYQNFTDEQYKELGIEIVDDINDCDVLFELKKFQRTLIADKSYFFFAYNQKSNLIIGNCYKLFLKKNIDLYDETIVNEMQVNWFWKIRRNCRAYNTIRVRTKVWIIQLKQRHFQRGADQSFEKTGFASVKNL
jgi:hypothetical protein